MSYNFDDNFRQKLIEMMAFFHDFCVKNNIKYYALGGTMLGAARHNGMIPWDDDIDVGIPRSDYNRLIELLNKQSFNIYKIAFPGDGTDYPYLYAKLYDSSTTLVEKLRSPFKRGLFIDIFPLDGLCDDEKMISKKFRYVRRKIMFYVSSMTCIRKNRGVLKNLTVILTRCIPNFLYNRKRNAIKINELCQSFGFDEKKYGGNFFGHWGLKEIMNNSIMGTPTLYKFENIYIYGVEDYDGYLTRLYGDWKTLPPKEKRITIHDFIECDLEKSYQEKLL